MNEKLSSFYHNNNIFSAALFTPFLSFSLCPSVSLIHSPSLSLSIYLIIYFTGRRWKIMHFVLTKTPLGSSRLNGYRDGGMCRLETSPTFAIWIYIRVHMCVHTERFAEQDHSLFLLWLCRYSKGFGAHVASHLSIQLSKIKLRTSYSRIWIRFWHF